MKPFLRVLLALLLVPLAASPLSAGKFNKKLNIGDPAPTWEKLEATDGRRYSFSDWNDKDVLVVVFTCNSCVVAENYEDRLMALAAECNKPDSRVGFVAINVNTGKADALPAMKERATQKKFNFPYLYDPSQKTARAYGALFTPECFVLNKDRRVVYMGAFDDKIAQPQKHYVADAVKAALAGRPAPVAETNAAAGCKIKFDKTSDDDD
ncbi:MAG: thioredoxin family protein [Gemmataceae bacterium]|nr:thioredoxin family protein [Gemmata sp.]MDW8196216.1 thioredoxin family protein [Gemmataceae bacterium]